MSSHFKFMGVSPNSTEKEIKSKFRQLSKEFHPDLGGPNASPVQMARLLEAYREIIEYSGTSRSAVTMACEMFSASELKMDGRFNVFPLRVLFEGQSEEDCFSESIIEKEEVSLQSEIVLKVWAHPDDSIADFKHSCQERHSDMLGFKERRKDRYNLAIGWEIITPTWPDHRILGNHFFLRDYGIQHCDTLFAVVEK